MIKLIVSNPHLDAPPPVPSATIRKIALQELEFVHRRKHLFDRDYEVDPENYANLTVYPESSVSGLWKLSQSITIGGVADAADHGHVYPSKLAAFDHGVGRIRRACAAAAPELSETVAAIRR